MGRNRKRSRLYWRDGRGWYADFRDFGDVGGEYGGKQKAMIPPGSRRATDDERVAHRLMTRILEDLEERRRRRQGRGDPQLRPYASSVLRRELEQHGLKESTIRGKRDALRNILEFFGEDVRLSEIDVPRLSEYIEWRSKQPGRPAGTSISPWTINNDLNALSSIYKWALSERAARMNPVAMLPHRPPRPTRERTFLDIDEAARLLEAAGEVDVRSRARTAEDGRSRLSFLRAIVATFLLTGGRKKEVLGLLRSDVHEGRIVRIRPNRYRRLKRDWHARNVPLWPQLEEILEEYSESLTADSGSEEPQALLFPSPRTGRMLVSLRKPLARALELAEIEKDVTNHTFRHTYCAARLQTTDNGAPVAPYTVARELGHRGTEMIEATYGHLLDSPHRKEVVEYTNSEGKDD